MALPSYYTPTPPYKAPVQPGQTVQDSLYHALSAGNAAGAAPANSTTNTAKGTGVSLPYDEFGNNTSAPKVVGQVPASASSPAPAAAGASGGGGGGGGGAGGYDFSGDPVLARTRAYTQMLVSQAESAALAGRKQAEIGYGYDPNVQYEDPATAEAARQNAFSTLAQLLFGHGERARGLDESLNKSNLFYSGERARQVGLEGRQYTLEQSQANQGLQNTMNQIAKALLDTRMSAQQQEIQAENDAYNRAVNEALLYGTGGGGGGGGGAPGGGGGGGVDMNDFIRGNNHTGLTDQQLLAAAQAGAPAGQTPHDVAQEGTVTYQNGRPGVMVKYDDPNGGTNTIWVPLG